MLLLGLTRVSFPSVLDCLSTAYIQAIHIVIHKLSTPYVSRETFGYLDDYFKLIV